MIGSPLKERALLAVEVCRFPVQLITPMAAFIISFGRSCTPWLSFPSEAPGGNRLDEVARGSGQCCSETLEIISRIIGTALLAVHPFLLGICHFETVIVAES